MALSSLNVITLLNIKGIGPKAVIKIGTSAETKSIGSAQDLYQILQDLKIKKGSITLDEIFEAEGKAKNIISRSERNGIGVVSYYDEEFPEILKHCKNEDGKDEPPVVLYYKGDWSITKMPCMAVIGTREILKEGEIAGKHFAGAFSNQGFCIVSGLAVGCDTAGHRGALEAGGKTIAFLAHGLDTIYPPENESLAKEIVDNGGLLISEYPIGSPINRYNLVARDRLQAGLSTAILVVHTGIHGGTMHAVNSTIAANKPLYVVKFQKEQIQRHEKVQGNQFLVEKKGAKYISSTDKIEDISQSILNRGQIKTSLF